MEYYQQLKYVGKLKFTEFFVYAFRVLINRFFCQYKIFLSTQLKRSINNLYILLLKDIFVGNLSQLPTAKAIDNVCW